MLDHYTGEGVFHSGINLGFLEVLEKHLENSDRDRNMRSILKQGPISPFLSWHSSSAATVTEILSFHTQAQGLPMDQWNARLKPEFFLHIKVLKFCSSFCQILLLSTLIGISGHTHVTLSCLLY
ncbi:putative histone deacetylase [Helianthus debilis subsp. tardiflorus]